MSYWLHFEKHFNPFLNTTPSVSIRASSMLTCTYMCQSVDIPTFSDVEYHQHLHDDNWSRPETDHLLELCKRFDLRFIVIHDRWDTQKFSKRSVEDIKERYYHIANTLAKVPHHSISWHPSVILIIFSLL